MGGPYLAFERWHESEAISGHTIHGPSPLNLISYFSKMNQICRL
jgi:hypothetical protein